MYVHTDTETPHGPAETPLPAVGAACLCRTRVSLQVGVKGTKSETSRDMTGGDDRWNRNGLEVACIDRRGC